MTTKSKIQNAMSHMMTSIAGGSHSKLHKRSAKTEKNEECEVGSSRSKVPKRNLKVEKTEEECEEDEFDPTLLPLPTTSTKAATQRIYKELKIIVHKQDTPSIDDLGFYVKLDKLRSVYQWVVQLTGFDPNIPLAQDMARHKVKSIDLEIRFAPDYPNLPPYIRVIRPRLLRFMNGGGGHVTAGGSICMDLLTLGNSRDQGWSPEYTMEAVLIQVKLALSTLNPPARLDRNWKNEYSPMEAMNAYIRVANQHGWGIPPQWDTLFKR